MNLKSIKIKIITLLVGKNKDLKLHFLNKYNDNDWIISKINEDIINHVINIAFEDCDKYLISLAIEDRIKNLENLSIGNKYFDNYDCKKDIYDLENLQKKYFSTELWR